MTAASPAGASRVGELLRSYAERGVFRAFGDDPAPGGSAAFRLRWHRGQPMRWVWNARRQTLRVEPVLRGVPPRSAMDRQLRAWLRARQDPALPDHRRCDPDRLALTLRNRAGEMTLTGRVLDGDPDYGVRTLVRLVNEVYLDFIADGPWFDWQVEVLGVDPDHPW